MVLLVLFSFVVVFFPLYPTIYSLEQFIYVHHREPSRLSSKIAYAYSSYCKQIMQFEVMKFWRGLDYNMKWVCDYRSEWQFKQLRKSPKKRISGLQRDSNP